MDPPADTTPVVFGGASLLLLFAMYRFDLFDVAPVAHETVFAGLEDAIVVVDESGRVLETNPAAREAFDLDGDGVGLPADRVLPDSPASAALLDGEDAEVVVDDDADAYSRGGEPTYFEATCEPLGREGVRLLVFRDVTERTRVERRYRAYVEHADDIIAVADADGVLEYISPAVEGVLGYDPELLEGASSPTTSTRTTGAGSPSRSPRASAGPARASGCRSASSTPTAAGGRSTASASTASTTPRSAAT
ncbi:PAS domain-containing protein [Halobaculum litoreum]|uniref:PAS domain-containing protein n=1 Tax=Halobaculum litoreum TaxID=3031998 RepID=A0ABD5XQI6_9EURY